MQAERIMKTPERQQRETRHRNAEQGASALDRVLASTSQAPTFNVRNIGSSDNFGNSSVLSDFHQTKRNHKQK